MTTIPQAGLYLFSYPTFAEKPQWVYIHFLTPDGQTAFVTYPHHPFQKAAQFIPVSWFETVNMVPMTGHSPLVCFLTETLPGLISAFITKKQSVDTFLVQLGVPEMASLQAA